MKTNSEDADTINAVNTTISILDEFLIYSSPPYNKRNIISKLVEFRERIKILGDKTIPETEVIMTWIADIMNRQDCIPNSSREEVEAMADSDVVKMRNLTNRDQSLNKFISTYTDLCSTGLYDDRVVIPAEISAENELIIRNIPVGTSNKIAIYVASEDGLSKATICVDIDGLKDSVKISSIIDAPTQNEIVESYMIQTDYASLPDEIGGKICDPSGNDKWHMYRFALTRRFSDNFIFPLSKNMMLVTPWNDAYYFGDDPKNPVYITPIVVKVDNKQKMSFTPVDELVKLNGAKTFGSYRPFTAITRNGKTLFFNGLFRWINVNANTNDIEIIETVDYTNWRFTDLQSDMLNFLMINYYIQCMWTPDLNLSTNDIYARSPYGYSLYNGFALIINVHIYIITPPPKSHVIIIEKATEDFGDLVTVLDPITNDIVDFLIMFESDTDLLYAVEIAVNGEFYTSYDHYMNATNKIILDTEHARSEAHTRSAAHNSHRALSYKNIFHIAYGGQDLKWAENRIYRYDGNHKFTRLYWINDGLNSKYNIPALNNILSGPQIGICDLNYTGTDEIDKTITHIVYIEVGINCVSANGFITTIELHLLIHDVDTCTFSTLRLLQYATSEKIPVFSNMPLNTLRVDNDTIIFSLDNYNKECADHITILKRSEIGLWEIQKTINISCTFIHAVGNQTYCITSFNEKTISFYKWENDDLILIKKIAPKVFNPTYYSELKANPFSNMLYYACALDMNNGLRIINDYAILPPNMITIKLKQNESSPFKYVLSKVCGVEDYTTFE